MYHQAVRNPHRFYIGIDPEARSLAKVSGKIYRKPSRGGTPNALFLFAAVEGLPEELRSTANEIYILFPWGSLLQAALTGHLANLQGLRSICQPEASIEVIVGVDPKKDRSEIERLQLPNLTPQYCKEILIPRYHIAGWTIDVVPIQSIPEGYRTSWARRLESGSPRSFFHLKGRALN